jgi:hypothetical protein
VAHELLTCAKTIHSRLQANVENMPLLCMNHEEEEAACRGEGSESHVSEYVAQLASGYKATARH